MATSGSIDFSVTRDEIIKSALELLGVVGAEETAESADVSTASRFLNMMVKSWQAKGIHLWKNQECTLVLTKSTYQYSFPTANASDTVVSTTIGAAEASGQTVITLTTTSGMTAADTILIQLDDGTLHSAAISSVDDATTVTIDTALAGAAAAGNEVYTFTAKSNRPFFISSIRRRTEGGNEYALNELSREEYFNLPNKSNTGTPTSWYYDPQLSTGELYVWPAPNTSSDSLKITYTKSIEDFDTANDNPDFPAEWLEALTWNLAARLAPIFSKEVKLQYIEPKAREMLNEALSWDHEHVSVKLHPSSYR